MIICSWLIVSPPFITGPDMQPCILVLLGDTFTMLYVQYSVSASVALCGLCCLLRAAESLLLTQLRSSSRREGV